jgi:DNA-binding GntR family transcriptional regulator
MAPQRTIASESKEAFERRTVRHAFERNPNHVWTRENLASWYGISMTIVEEAIGELLHRGALRKVPGGYRANGRRVGHGVAAHA